jgi:hypothetical protein
MDATEILSVGSNILKWLVEWAYTTRGTEGLFLFFVGFLAHWIYSAVTGKLWKYIAVGLVLLAVVYYGYSLSNPGADMNMMVDTVMNATSTTTSSTLLPVV